MINSKKELEFFIKADRMMNLGKFQPSLKDRIRELLWPNEVMKFLVLLRYCQFYGASGGGMNRLAYLYYKRRFNKISIKLGFSISPDVFGYGLVIPHYGTIVVGNPNRIGNYCVLHTSTCISGNGKVIGDGLYLATGAKITTKLVLGNNISVAANSVVNKSFDEDNLLIAGTPASIKCSSQAWYIRDGEEYLRKVRACEALKKQLGL